MSGPSRMAARATFSPRWAAEDLTATGRVRGTAGPSSTVAAIAPLPCCVTRLPPAFATVHVRTLHNMAFPIGHMQGDPG